jgi:hypothetical protein
MPNFKKRFDFEIENIIEQKNKNIMVFSNSSHDNIMVIITHNNIYFRLKVDLVSSEFPQKPPKIDIVEICSIDNSKHNKKIIIEKKNKIIKKINYLSSLYDWSPANRIYCFLCEILEEIK